MKNSSSVFSLSGTAFIVALSTLMLFLSTILPTGRLALMCLAAAIQCACVIEFGRGYGIAAALSCSLLTLLFSPNIYLSVMYIFLFSAYPVLKSFFELPDNRTIRIAIKGTYFLAVSGAFAVLAYKVIQLPVLVVFIGAFLVLIISEFALNIFISFYLSQISPKLKGFHNKQRR